MPSSSNLIAKELQHVDAVISTHLQSDVPLVGQICRYIIDAGGKRLRPALLLLVSGCLHSQDPRRYELAAVVEFIHTATLLHDDVVDESTLRRGRATANQHFGNAASVLVGDFLYSRSFQMMVSLGNMRVLSILSDATNIIAEGEVQQLINTRDVALTQAAYLRVIESKTAKLFEASSQLGAVFVNADKQIEQAAATYGRHLGTAFQIIDDVLDYDGDVLQLGKNLGDDLREGKVTLPLILAMQRAKAQDRQYIEHVITSGEDDDLSSILRIVKETDAIQTSYSLASEQALTASNAIADLPENEYKQVLLQLAIQLTHRRS